MRFASARLMGAGVAALAAAIAVSAQGHAGHGGNGADPRVGLKPGFKNAGTAISNLELVANLR